MKVTINKKEQDVPDGCTVRQLLGLLGLEPTRASVWVNQRQVWQREYEALKLSEGDVVRIIKPVAGG